MSQNDAMPDGISDEDMTRFQDLFSRLDVNKDGKIEVKELADALKAQHGSRGDTHKHAEVCFLDNSF